jgi:hypothetical protein
MIRTRVRIDQDEPNVASVIPAALATSTPPGFVSDLHLTAYDSNSEEESSIVVGSGTFVAPCTRRHISCESDHETLLTRSTLHHEEKKDTGSRQSVSPRAEKVKMSVFQKAKVLVETRWTKGKRGSRSNEKPSRRKKKKGGAKKPKKSPEEAAVVIQRHVRAKKATQVVLELKQKGALEQAQDLLASYEAKGKRGTKGKRGSASNDKPSRKKKRKGGAKKSQEEAAIVIQSHMRAKRATRVAQGLPQRREEIVGEGVAGHAEKNGESYRHRHKHNKHHHNRHRHKHNKHHHK